LIPRHAAKSNMTYWTMSRREISLGNLSTGLAQVWRHGSLDSLAIGLALMLDQRLAPDFLDAAGALGPLVGAVDRAG